MAMTLVYRATLAVKSAAVPVMFVPTSAEGVPRSGVVREGLIEKTTFPLPVSVVSMDKKFAEEGLDKKVAAPVASPVTFEIRYPVDAAKFALTEPVATGGVKVKVLDTLCTFQ